MLKETETEETIGFFATFLSQITLQSGREPTDPPGYANDQVALAPSNQIQYFVQWAFPLACFFQKYFVA